MKATTTHNSELVNYAINGMDNISEGQYACDLHNELFNMDILLLVITMLKNG
jgi:hypothetical protein